MDHRGGFRNVFRGARFLSALAPDRGALDALMRDRTTIVIAHRLSTVCNAERLAALDRGHVVEAGSHTELLARGGLYARLIHRQLAGAQQQARLAGN